MSIEGYNSGLRLKAHRRRFIVTDNHMPRLSATVRPDQHAAFDRMAQARGITHTALVRQLIEASIRRPDLFDAMLTAPTEEQ